MNEYYYSKNGETKGPMTLENLKLVDLDKENLIWYEGLKEWEKLENLSELLNELSTFKKSVPPPLPIKSNEDEIILNTLKELNLDFLINNTFYSFKEIIIKKYPSINIISMEQKLKTVIREKIEEMFLVTTTQKRVKIRVNFLDCTTIFHNKVTTTFIETLRKVGFDKVKQMKIKVNSLDLISEEKYENYGMHLLETNDYVFTGTSTETKIKLLKQISIKSGLNFKIEEL